MGPLLSSGYFIVASASSQIGRLSVKSGSWISKPWRCKTEGFVVFRRNSAWKQDVPRGCQWMCFLLLRPPFCFLKTCTLLGALTSCFSHWVKFIVSVGVFWVMSLSWVCVLVLIWRFSTILSTQSTLHNLCIHPITRCFLTNIHSLMDALVCRLGWSQELNHQPPDDLSGHIVMVATFIWIHLLCLSVRDEAGHGNLTDFQNSDFFFPSFPSKK